MPYLYKMEADMLSITLIQKLFDAHDHCRMVGCLSENGMTLPLTLRARLSHATGAIGLGLRRLVELTYGPTSLSVDMTQALLSQQHADGSFQGDCDRDPLATAAAAAAIAAVIRESPAQAQPDTALPDALDRALASLASMQDDAGLFRHEDDRTEQDRALTSAFILFLLARISAFRAAARFAELMTWFDERADRLVPDTLELYHMASLDDPAHYPASPAMDAIAA